MLSDKEKGGRFAELRGRLGWTPTEAARQLQTDPSNVAKWEKGTKPIPEHVLEAIAKAAAESVVYLLVSSAETEQSQKRDNLVIAGWLEAEAAKLRARGPTAGADGESTTPPTVVPNRPPDPPPDGGHHGEKDVV